MEYCMHQFIPDSLFWDNPADAGNLGYNILNQLNNYCFCSLNQIINPKNI
jgi:hypothetical protein